jgi:hypothetical protein
VISEVRPQMACFGHYHRVYSGDVFGVPCFGLAKTGYEGSLLAVQMSPASKSAPYCAILGRFPALP